VEAESHFRQALAIWEKILGTEHPYTADSLRRLALDCFAHQERQGEAETLFRRALAIRERVLGEEHPDTVRSLYELAALIHRRGFPAKLNLSTSAP